MKKDTLSSLSRVALVLALALGQVAAHAEVDVLERPAMVLSRERLATSVVLDMVKAGSRLVAVGERGVIRWSDDGGALWHQAKVPVSVTLTSVSFADAERGWAVGHSGVVVATTDSGKTWVKQMDGIRLAQLVVAESQMPNASADLKANAERLLADGPDKPLLSVHFMDRNNGLVVGAYGLILRTDDGGNSWQSISAHVENPKGLHLYAVEQAANHLYLFGEQGSVHVSDDLGGSFRKLVTPYQGTYFGGLVAGDTLLAYGMRGNAYWSRNRGATWERSAIPGNNTFTAATRLGSGEIVAVDERGALFVSHDEGRSFVAQGDSTRTPLTSVVEVAAGQVLIAGTRGMGKATQVVANQEKK